MPYFLGNVQAKEVRSHKKFQNKNPKLIMNHLREAIAFNGFVSVPCIDREPEVVFDNKKHKNRSACHQQEIDFIVQIF